MRPAAAVPGVANDPSRTLISPQDSQVLCLVAEGVNTPQQRSGPVAIGCIAIRAVAPASGC
jgi:hypothetical protein